MQTSLSMDKKLERLSCPFTWDMENVIQNINKLLETKNDRLEVVDDIQDEFPESPLIYQLMLAFENAMNEDLPTALECIDKAEQVFAKIKETKTLENVEGILQHISEATKCYILKKMGRLTEVYNLLDDIRGVGNMDQSELAMLHGCQCFAWSLYYATDNLKAINYAKEAIKLDPDNGKWYFLLAKNYRRLRRKHEVAQLPSGDEISAYKEAYRLSKNSLFGASLAQSYRESQQDDQATRMYEEIYTLEPTSCTVRLQLALGFIRARKCYQAEKCLRYVGERMPDSLVYNHYMGIYYTKCRRNIQAALPYYEKAIEKSNFGAEWQYIECKKKVTEHWDPLPYLLDLLNKYEGTSDFKIQEINIQIGLYYLLEIKHIISACQFLTVAIEMNPEDRQLQKFFPVLNPGRPINVYRSLKAGVQSALNESGEEYDADSIQVLNKTLELCLENSRA